MKLIPTKRMLKRWAISLGILLGLLLLINAVLAWRTESRFEQLIAAVRGEGDPASITELAPPSIPAVQNAAALIDGMKLRLADFGKEHGEFYQTELGKQLDALPPHEPPNDEQVAVMQAILDRYSDLEQQIQSALSAPQYASTADFSLGFNRFLEAQLARLQQLRTIARFVDWRVQTSLAQGNQQAAIEWSLSLLDLSELCKGEPTVVSYLVTVAMRNIALHDLHQSLLAGPTDSATYAKIDTALDRLELSNHVESALRTERALSISACIEQGWKQAPRVIGNLLGWPIKRHFLGPIELYDQIIPLADVPYNEIQKEFQAGGSLAVPTGKGVLADLLVPSVQGAIEASNRDIALIRSLRVLNALRHAGDHAQGLDDIDLPTAATIDPFTGKPLVVKKTDGGWLVYSVGKDQTDDSGMFEQAKDLGFGPAKGGDSTNRDQ